MTPKTHFSHITHTPELRRPFVRSISAEEEEEEGRVPFKITVRGNVCRTINMISSHEFYTTQGNISAVNGNNKKALWEDLFCGHVYKKNKAKNNCFY